MLLFFIVCESALFADFCRFWVREDSISASFLASLSDLWAFGKTAESVVRVVNFRGLTPPRWSLFVVLGCGCVSRMIFKLIYMIFRCLGEKYVPSLVPESPY